MLRALLYATLVIFCSAPSWAQGTYTQIDPPGSIATYCQGIDSAGDIVGSYEDASLVTHGFILSGGVYTTIDYPGSTLTYLAGINDVGQIVGGTGTGNNPEFGFLYDLPTQTFTETINYPGSAATFPTAINNSGAVVGYYTVIVNGHEFEYGFGLLGSTYFKIQPPGGGPSTQATGVTNFDAVVGDSSLLGSFSLYRGVYKQITIPNDPGAGILGVNPSGTGVVGRHSIGGTSFLYANKKLATVAFPGADSTYAFGVNTSNEVTGYFNVPGAYHGFVWTPPASPTK